MSWLSDIKQDIADRLSEYRVLAYVPESVRAPGGWVRDGDPLIESVSGERFSEKRLNLVVIIALALKTNSSSAQDMGDVLDTVVQELEINSNYTVHRVSTALMEDESTKKFHPTATVELSTIIEFKE